MARPEVDKVVQHTGSRAQDSSTCTEATTYTEKADTSRRQAVKIVTSAATAGLTSLINACGSGNNPQQNSAISTAAAQNTADEKYKPQPTPPTIALEAWQTPQARASRFAQMAALNATDTDIDFLVSGGEQRWLDNQLDQTEPGSRFDWMRAQGYAIQANRNNAKGFNNSVWRRLFTASNPVTQRWVLALSEIFVINPVNLKGSGGWRGFGGAAYLDMLEANCLGSYRNLLQEVTKSQQMGAYLSLMGSKKANTAGRAPDENYAREILQLFSIGLYELNLDGSLRLDSNNNPIETYTNSDITGLAAALTGWDKNFTTEEAASSPDYLLRRMIMREENHEPGALQFLGTTIPAGTPGEEALKITLDKIASHPNVGPFLARQFIARLVTSNPSAEYIARVAAVFNSDVNSQRGNLRAVLYAVLLDPEALEVPAGELSYQGKLREPMLRFIQWGRTFNFDDPNGTWDIKGLSDPGKALGQSPLLSPSVFNFFRPGFVPPNTELGNRGLVAPELQITSETSVVGYANFMHVKIAYGNGSVKADYAAELALVNDPDALVSRLNLLLAANQLSDQTIEHIVTAIEAMQGDGATEIQRVHGAILMVMLSADYLVLS